jgi:hypothetical protein
LRERKKEKSWEMTMGTLMGEMKAVQWECEWG